LVASDDTVGRLTAEQISGVVRGNLGLLVIDLVGLVAVANGTWCYLWSCQLGVEILVWCVHVVLWWWKIVVAEVGIVVDGICSGWEWTV